MELEVKNVTKSFEAHEVLHGISFSVKSGRALGLLGRNGAGKTTTIRILMDVFHADSGEVLMDGETFKRSPGMVGYLPEERGLYPKKKVRDQMMYLARLRGMNRREAEAAVKKWLDRLAVSEHADKKLETLSKGNQQKVQLAATLVAEPEIVILDEPFSGLDPVNSQVLKETIGELIAEGRIVIFSSHQMSYVEEFCEDIVLIDQGKIALSGNLQDIKTEFGKGRNILSAENYGIYDLAEIFRKKLTEICTVERETNQGVILQMKPAATQWEMLDGCRKEGIAIHRFGVYEPSLAEIFVACVGEEEQALEGNSSDKRQEMGA